MGAANWPSCDPGLYGLKGVNPLSNIKGPYCAPCPLGFWCEGGYKNDPHPCPEGYSGVATGMTDK